MSDDFKDRVKRVALRQARADRLSAFIARYVDQIEAESESLLAWPFELREWDRRFLKVQRIQVT